MSGFQSGCRPVTFVLRVLTTALPKEQWIKHKETIIISQSLTSALNNKHKINFFKVLLIFSVILGGNYGQKVAKRKLNRRTLN